MDDPIEEWWDKEYQALLILLGNSCIVDEKEKIENFSYIQDKKKILIKQIAKTKEYCDYYHNNRTKIPVHYFFKKRQELNKRILKYEHNLAMREANHKFRLLMLEEQKRKIIREHQQRTMHQ